MLFRMNYACGGDSAERSICRAPAELYIRIPVFDWNHNVNVLSKSKIFTQAKKRQDNAKQIEINMKRHGKTRCWLHTAFNFNSSSRNTSIDLLQLPCSFLTYSITKNKNWISRKIGTRNDVIFLAYDLLPRFVHRADDSSNN